VNRTLQTVIAGTALAGTLDIVSAFVFAGMSGMTPAQVMRFVASGPFGDGMREGGATGVALGFLTHFSIMAAMVMVFVLAAQRLPALLRNPVLWGAAYGIGLYLVMYWAVRPIRWPGMWPALTAWGLGNALFSHIVCVGIPIALVAARMLRNARPA